MIPTSKIVASTASTLVSYLEATQSNKISWMTVCISVIMSTGISLSSIIYYDKIYKRK